MVVLEHLAIETGKADVYLNEKDLNEKDNYFNFLVFILCHLLSSLLLSPLSPLPLERLKPLHWEEWQNY